ncbi:MAG: rod shape-determining protein MreC [Pseudomonadota bacterium]|nr:rod shape-determining protein MreC [Pseudomonadota bacterium]
MIKNSHSHRSGIAIALTRVTGGGSALFLVLIALALMVSGMLKPHMIARMRVTVVDTFTPALEAVAHPAATLSGITAEIGALASLRVENARLRTENERLHSWYQAALTLKAENKSLKTLLNFKPDAAYRSIVARVVADMSGAFARSFLVNAGLNDGVAKGQAVMDGFGVIGRIQETGKNSARVLLITDRNSRIPVRLETSRRHAVATGDNADVLRLLYLPDDDAVVVGERVVTSGHGGLLPPGLEIGKIAQANASGIWVRPAAALNTTGIVRILHWDGARPLTFGQTP